MNVISFCAVSTLEQAGDDKASLSNQRKANADAAKILGGQIGWTIEITESRSIDFADEAIAKIAGYAELDEVLRSGNADVLCLWDLTRLGRTQLLIMHFIQLAWRYGCVIYRTQSPVHISDLTVEKQRESLPLILSVQAWSSENEIKKISARTRVGMYASVEAGNIISRTPFGYKKMWANDGSYYHVIDDIAGPLVREIFEKYLAGETLRQISKNGRHPRSIKHIIGRAWTYAGYVEFNKASDSEYIRATGKHPAIIDDETAAAALREREIRANANRIVSSPYYFSGVVRHECGYKMAGVKRLRVRCDNCRPTVSINEDILLSMLREWLEEAAKGLPKNAGKLKGNNVALGRIEKLEEIDYQEKFDRLTYLFANNIIGIEEYTKSRAAIEEDKEADMQELDRLRDQVSESATLAPDLAQQILDAFDYHTSLEKPKANAWIRRFFELTFTYERTLIVKLVQ